MIKVKDITNSTKWRNTKNRIHKLPVSSQSNIISELLDYIEVLENQIMELDRRINDYSTPDDAA